MAVRNPHIESVDVFSGLNTIGPATNQSPENWIESSNMIVAASGSAVALRSPKAWNTSPGVSTVLSTFSYNSVVFGSFVLFEVYSGGATQVYVTSGSNNVSVGSPITETAGQRLGWASANGKAYAFNGSGTPNQFFYDQSSVAFVTYPVGIGQPVAAPTVSIVAGGTLALNVGVTVSYAYYNSKTLHVGQCSATSTNSGPTSGGNQTLQVAVTASATTGVDKIVLFVTLDGGAIRYLVIDSSGNPVLYNNSTGNITITAPYLVDQNTTETTFNQPAPPYYQVAFKHQDRIILVNGNNSATFNVIRYSGLESIGIGNPTECYPLLNIVAVPAKESQWLKGGISTPVGALVMSDRESYLLSGQLIDITISAQNTLQSSYSFTSLQWGVGTRSPFTMKATPFGVIWLDQAKRLQLWPYSGLPTEIGIALRNELANIQDTDAARLMAEATWFQYGEQQYYVLTASTSGSTNNALFIIGVYESAAHTTNAYQTLSHPITVTTAKSDIAAQSIITHIDTNGLSHCLIAELLANNGSADGGLKEILNLNLQGDGWKSTQQIYFGVASGNFAKNMNWNVVNSLRYDSNVADATVQVRNFDDSEVTTAKPVLQPNEDQTLQAVINRYGVHKKIRFSFPTDDTKRREINNLRITYSGKTRP